MKKKTKKRKKNIVVGFEKFVSTVPTVSKINKIRRGRVPPAGDWEPDPEIVGVDDREPNIPETQPYWFRPATGFKDPLLQLRSSASDGSDSLGARPLPGRKASIRVEARVDDGVAHRLRDGSKRSTRASKRQVEEHELREWERMKALLARGPEALAHERSRVDAALVARGPGEPPHEHSAQDFQIDTATLPPGVARAIEAEGKLISLVDELENLGKKLTPSGLFVPGADSRKTGSPASETEPMEVGLGEQQLPGGGTGGSRRMKVDEASMPPGPTDQESLMENAQREPAPANGSEADRGLHHELGAGETSPPSHHLAAKRGEILAEFQSLLISAKQEASNAPADKGEGKNSKGHGAQLGHNRSAVENEFRDRVNEYKGLIRVLKQKKNQKD